MWSLRVCNLTNHKGLLSYLLRAFEFRTLQSAFTCTVGFSQIRRDYFSNKVNRMVFAVQTRSNCLRWGRNVILVHYSDKIHIWQDEQHMHLPLWKVCCIFLPSTLIFLVHFDITSLSTERVTGLDISGHAAVRGMFHTLSTWTELSICCGVHRYFRIYWRVYVYCVLFE